MAQRLKDQNNKRVMQEIAHAYERLAQRADELADPQRAPPKSVHHITSIFVTSPVQFSRGVRNA
jgi:hypothetical protein